MNLFWIVLGCCGLLWILFGSLWVLWLAVDFCVSLRVVIDHGGFFFIVVGHCCLLWVAPCFSKYGQIAIATS